MARFAREQSLSIFFGALFLASLAGQAIAGHADFNAEQRTHHEHAVSFGVYVTSSSFGRAVLENWQSEYLQFMLFMLATVWLVQRGSPESKEPGRAGRESAEEQLIGRHARASSPVWARVGGWRTAVYSNSLLIVMTLIFLGSWFGHSVTGWTDYNDERVVHGEHRLSWLQFVASSRFWEQTFQNWQSEFLAVGSFVVLTIYLRQRGSPESKPVGAPHGATGVEG